ncbi:EpsG family protein [Rossellomorea vietnamensis]|uniref:EpsG family protein n=1 Tax=Rossellomorea vietnamensis TaxID=218284 RepID=UPI003CED9B3C
MVIYYALLVISIFFSKINEHFKILISGYKIQIIYIINVIILLAVAMLRSENIGKDTPHYEIYFNNILIGNTSDLPYEPGFYFITRTFQYFSNDFQFFLAFCSLITLIPILYVLKKENNNYFWITIFIFISTQYVSSFSIIRGYLAMAFILFAYQFINNPAKKKMYWLFMFIALLFHYFTFIYMCLLWLSKKRIKIRYYLISLFVAGFFVIPHVGEYSRGLAINILDYIRPGYSYYGMDVEMNTSGVYIFIFGIIVILSIIYYEQLVKINNKNEILIKISILLLIFNISMSWFPAYSRLSSSALIFMALLVPEIIKCEGNRATRFIYKIGFCMIFIIYMYLNLPPLYSIYSLNDH